MKKLIAVLMAMNICFLTGSVHAQEKITMYSIDGSRITVSASEAEEYKKVGWYDNLSQVTTVMYSADGRETTVFIGEVPEYKNVGWYENLSDVTKTMYSLDGREITVFLTDVPAYRAVGWYDSRSQVTKTMYSTDGREITVLLKDVDAYRNVGWYDSIEDVTRIMYSLDGRQLRVFLGDVEAYKQVGWFDDIDAVSKEMYSIDGRSIRVLLKDIDAYKKVGWYDDIRDVTKILYAPDGREITVFLSEVDAYKQVGWYEYKSHVQKTLYSRDGREIAVFLDDVEAYKQVGWYEIRPYGVDPLKPMIALTFDDGPKASTTPSILDTLEKYGARATFFVLGNSAKNNPDILQRMVSIGCQIGNHSYSHPDLKTYSATNVAYQIDTTEAIVSSIVGFEPAVVRPPYGSYNKDIMAIADKPFILWSVDTLDWKYRDAEYVKNYVLKTARDGAIILMHDIHSTTAEAVKSIVPELIAKGYQLVTIDELAAHKGYTLQSGYVYSQFK